MDQKAAETVIFNFLCRKYVQRADTRQKSMGLQYTEAETHDLAKEIAGLFGRIADAERDADGGGDEP